MKKTIISTIFLIVALSSSLFASDKISKNNENNIITYDELQSEAFLIEGCMNYYSVTKIDCAGSASTVNLGGNRGDCGGHQEGDILFHNTTMNSCNGKAVATSVVSILAIASTIATAL